MTAVASGPIGVMRRDADEMGFRERGDAAHLRNAADDADIGLDDIRTLYLKKTQELIAIIKAFTGCQRAVQPLFQVSPHLDVFRAQRLFEEQRIIRGKRIAKLAGGRWLENLGMGVKGDVVVRPHRFAKRTEIFGGTAHHLAPAMGVDIEAPRAELEGREAPILVETVEFLLCRRRIRSGVDTGIDLDTVAHFAAQQLVDRHARRLGR